MTRVMQLLMLVAVLGSTAVSVAQTSPGQQPGSPPQPGGGQGRGQPQPPPPGTTNDPFPQPIETTADVIKVKFVEFATIPDVDGQPARTMTMVDEPGTRRLFASDMRGILYTVSYDGKAITMYLDLRDPKWSVSPQSQGSELKHPPQDHIAKPNEHGTSCAVSRDSMHRLRRFQR